MTFILETSKVVYSYGDGTKALKGVSISLEEGRKIALVGPNGAGKSTLLLMFNGILRPTSGKVLFRGQPLQYDSAHIREIRRKVGMVFQNSDDQIFAPTVYQDVAFGPVNLGFSKEKMKKHASYALQYVGLSGYERRPPHHLSGGEKKRVAIAGILAMESEVIILDEPTSNLDPASSEEIMDMLDELNCGGKTMIISTHDVDLAYRWADEVVLMEDGRVIRRGTGPEVFGDADLIKKARLKLPIVVDLYNELSCRGLLKGGKPPQSMLELTDLLESNARGSISQRREAPGRIHLCNVDGADPESIIDILEKSHLSYSGAMGPNAKVVAERSGIPLDFTYGVIDKCILKAIIGKSSLIMTSGRMMDRAMSRIRTYGKESGVEIEVIKLTLPLGSHTVVYGPGQARYKMLS
ncbi:MAG: ATP-binding cassette domain-containing protein [Methanothrix sp.]|jgi:cobalt/nickel transport system ATP-binding protein|nr:ATP-binding cassette domain-containing protein [Methanothrix sp.]